MIGEVAVLKDYLPYKHDLFAIILLYTFLAVFFNPLRIFQSVIRFPAIIATFHCLYSPFSEVRFLEFFVADVMTSLVKPFIDVSLIICWASSTDEDNVFDTGKCHSKMFWAIFAWYLPFHIRFWQCVNKWWYTGDAFPHLVNAGKYFASIVMICSNYFYGKNPDLRNVVLGLYLFATVYSYIWDIIMDWGLLRDKRMLRAQILYPPRYYYFSCITNFFLRFAWTLGFIPASYWPDTFRNIEGLTLILAIMEIYRRAQWSLFRLENENINNYEKYRTVLEIPRLPKD